MANTTNFGWETPDDTDLVKDGAAAMRTLGNSIDASFVDLKGGTTGQVLAKASNSDLDFTWTSGGDITGVTAGTGISGGGTSGDVTITNSMATAIDAKGDLIVGTGADAFARLAVGATNGHTLQVDSATATGVKWAANPTPTTSWSLVNPGGTALTGAATITVSGISNADKIMILVKNASTTSASEEICIRLNGDSGSNYNFYGGTYEFAASYAAGNFYNQTAENQTSQVLGLLSNNAGSVLSGFMEITGCNSSGVKVFTSEGFSSAATGNGARHWQGAGFYNSTSVITSISVRSTGGNLDFGTVFVYTSA